MLTILKNAVEIIPEYFLHFLPFVFCLLLLLLFLAEIDAKAYSDSLVVVPSQGKEKISVT